MFEIVRERRQPSSKFKSGLLECFGAQLSV